MKTSAQGTQKQNFVTFVSFCYQKSRGTRGDDSPSASRVNANRYVHSHARLEVRNRPFLSIYIDLDKRSHDERSSFLLVGHRNRVCSDVRDNGRALFRWRRFLFPAGRKTWIRRKDLNQRTRKNDRNSECSHPALL